jgi:hypothetical protein
MNLKDLRLQENAMAGLLLLASLETAQKNLHHHAENLKSANVLRKLADI